MKRQFLVRLVASSLVLLLAGCATNSLQYDHGIRVVELPGADAAAGQAVISGQARMRGYGDWVVVFVSAVDQEKVFSPLKLRPNINLQIPGGKHTLKVRAAFGNFMQSQETDEVSLAVNVVGGQAYQLNAREVTNIRGQQGVELWLEHLGTIAQFEAFRKRNPGKKGEPLSSSDVRSAP